MSDLEVRLRDVVSQLEQHSITTADAAALVRKIKFPPPSPKTTWQRIEADGAGDPEVPERGSFFVVSQAYMAGRLDREQYTALARAAAEAMKESAGGQDAVPGTAPGQAEPAAG